MRKRLRPLPDLDATYPKPHDHTIHADHHLRVNATIQVAQWVDDQAGGFYLAADLSCGDGAILKATPAARRYFGDYAPGYEFTGPIEETIRQIPMVDLFINCETLEHVDDPDAVLSAIRAKADTLILSTPVGAFNDPNPEHVWAWSRQDIETMMLVAGFRPFLYTLVDFTPMGMMYAFGIWAAR